MGPGPSGAAGMHKPQQRSTTFTLLFPGLASVISKFRAQTCTDGAWTNVCPLNYKTESVSKPVSIRSSQNRSRFPRRGQAPGQSPAPARFPYAAQNQLPGSNLLDERTDNPRDAHPFLDGFGGFPHLPPPPRPHSLVQPEGPWRVQRQPRRVPLGGAERHLPGRGAGRGAGRGQGTLRGGTREGVSGTPAWTRDRGGTERRGPGATGRTDRRARGRVVTAMDMAKGPLERMGGSPKGTGDRAIPLVPLLQGIAEGNR